VVWQANSGNPCGVLWLIAGDPRKFGDGDGCHRYESYGLCPPALTVFTALADEAFGVRGRADVVPQQSGADDCAVGIEDHAAVLLSADGDGFDVIDPAGSGDGLLERVPPRGWIYLGARWMRSAAGANDPPGLRIADDHLAGLR